MGSNILILCERPIDLGNKMKSFYERALRFQNSLDGWSYFFKLCVIFILIIIIVQFFLVYSLMTAKMDVRTGDMKVRYGIEELDETERAQDNSQKIYH